MNEYIKSKNFNLVLFFLVCFLVVEFLLLKNTPFFWDAISKSYRADWIYKNGLSEFIVPVDYNSGHPPLWISLLAGFWTLFSKTLWSSRLLLLIVNIGVVWQVVLLCKNNFIKTVSVFYMLLVCLDPTFIAQTTSLSNDMLLLFFTLLGLNSLIKSKSIWYTIALVGLLFTNLRGIYIVGALLVIHLIYVKFKLIAVKKAMFYGYLVAFLCFALFCYFQYEKLGWFIISQNENYNEHRQSVGVKQILINTIVFGKSFLEYGRFIIILFLTPLIVKYLKNKDQRSVEIDRVGIAFFVFGLIFFLGVVPFSNPFGDRYFMICYLLSIILLVNLLAFYNTARQPLIYLSIVFMFISGHFWIYPATISQPWDSSLAYLNYYNVEKDMENYIDSVGINHTDIGTRIRLNDREYSELKPLVVDKLYADFNINSNSYILLSNIENMTKDDELNEIRNNWKLVKSYSQLGVFMSLYKRD